MTHLPQTFYNIKKNVIFVVCATLFFLAFAIIYTPTFGSSETTMRKWGTLSDFCIPILAAIAFVVLALSRTILILANRKKSLSRFEYFIWMLGELLAIALFADLFLSLYLHYSFFTLLPRICSIMISIAIYPYIISWTHSELQDRESRLSASNEEIAQLRQGLDSANVGTINFPDENGNIKLAAKVEDIISIESAGNYVTILYKDEGNLTRFALRNTLKGIEGICQENNLVRCHRSFFINIHHIKLLKKDNAGMQAVIDIANVPNIPISKSFAQEVTQRFSTRV